MSKQPPWLDLALREVGTKEIPGPASNPTVEGYYDDAVGETFNDAVPWCAAFVGAILKRAGYKPSGSLWARSYLHWGKPLPNPILGCIVVFSRGTSSQGHVAFYLSREDGRVRVVGGNQSDAVTIATYSKHRVLGYRWPAEKLVQQPKENVNGNETT